MRNLFNAKLLLTFSKWLRSLLTDPCSSSQAEEKRRWDSLCSTCVLAGGSRVPQWCSQDRAGCRHYRALVYGAGCSKNRDPSQRDCGNVVFAAWWVQGVKHWHSQTWGRPRKHHPLHWFPAGPGPFPALLDLWGMGGGLMEYRSALCASRGYASLSLAYFGHKDIPGPPNCINVGDSYFRVGCRFLRYLLLH